MEDDFSSNPSSPSLKHKIKHSVCFSCCFGRLNRHHHLPSPPLPSDDNPTLIWVKPHDHCVSEIKEKCCSFLGISGTKHRTEYKYDQSSYSLNFDDAFCGEDDSAPLKGFCARLPPSPPVAPPLIMRESSSCVKPLPV